MAISFQQDIKSDSINFSNNSLISNSGGWKFTNGSIISNKLILNNNSSCTLFLNNPLQDRFVQYLKILAVATCEDKTLSTDSEHYLSVCLLIKYKDNNETKSSVEIFYPKFDFEDLFVDNIVDNYSIISLNDKQIVSIEITIYNDYNTTVIINTTGLYYCLTPVTEQQLDNYLNSAEYLDNLFNSFTEGDNYFNSSEYLDNLFNDFTEGLEQGNIDLVIPLVQSLPDINSVPDGYICRLATIDAKD